jgi:hypothetical protein
VRARPRAHRAHAAHAHAARAHAAHAHAARAPASASASAARACSPARAARRASATARAMPRWARRLLPFSLALGPTVCGRPQLVCARPPARTSAHVHARGGRGYAARAGRRRAGASRRSARVAHAHGVGDGLPARERRSHVLLYYLAYQIQCCSTKAPSRTGSTIECRCLVMNFMTQEAPMSFLRHPLVRFRRDHHRYDGIDAWIRFRPIRRPKK